MSDPASISQKLPIGSPPERHAEHSGESGELLIRRGVCIVQFALDLGLSINLDEAERVLARRIEGTEQRETFRRSRRAPRYFEFKPPPLRFSSPCDRIGVCGRETTASVDAVLYDFGAVSISYSIQLDSPHGTPLCDLQDLSNELYENAALSKDARTRAEKIAASLGGAIVKPNLSSLIEDYLIYQITDYEILTGAGRPGGADRETTGGRSLEDWIRSHRSEVARILRAEREPLSSQEIDDAVNSRISYGEHDAAIIDWNASILFDRDPADATAALEFANVELLELRHLDDRLDGSLEEAYQALQQRAWKRRLLSRLAAHDLRRVAELQMESAMLFENVNNALKLLGDQYLARVYRMAAQRLHMPEWDTSILRKLGTLESIYEKMSDQQNARRSEVLEWIIIILIAFEVVMSFVRH